MLSLRKRALFANGGNLMIGFLAIGAVVGIILGLRFKVLVLVPAITAFDWRWLQQWVCWTASN